MKKSVFVLLMIVVLLIAGCQKVDNASEPGKKTVTVTTTFLEDMVQQLVGDKVSIQLIIPAGEDPHLYIAKPQDLEKFNNADLVLYHGLHFEGKMTDILEEKGHAVTKDFPQDKVGTMDDDGQIAIDPHFWFNMELYQLAVKNAAEQLKTLLPDQSKDIDERLQAYLEQLQNLDNEVREAIQSIPKENRYLITPHDAFNYFSKSYDIPVRAPQGISTDSEVANRDIDDTVNFIIEHQVKAIFAESTTDPARMKKLQEAAKAKGFEVKVVSGENQELFSDSLAPKGHPGDNFIDMVRHNVKLIVDHLK